MRFLFLSVLLLQYGFCYGQSKQIKSITTNSYYAVSVKDKLKPHGELDKSHVEFNQSGLMVSQIFYNGDQPESASYFSYDSTHKLTKSKKLSYSKGNNIVKHFIRMCNYDSSGNRISEVDSVSTKILVKYYHSDSSDFDLKHYINYNGMDNDSVVELVSKSSRQLLRKTKFKMRSDSTWYLSSILKYEYNKSGKLIKQMFIYRLLESDSFKIDNSFTYEITYGGHGEIEKIIFNSGKEYFYSYKFDKFDNWIYLEKKSKDGNWSEIIKRQIKYY